MGTLGPVASAFPPAGFVLGGGTASAIELLETLGSGPRCHVYRALDRVLEREVVVRVFSREISGSPENMSLLRREVELATTLAHPHIARVHRADLAPDGWLYVVEELVDGSTVESRLAAAGGPLTPSLAISITLQICEALQHAHEGAAPRVHGALSPDKVVVTKRDDADWAVLVGFGVPHTLLDERRSSARDNAYVSPEVERGNAPGPQDDVYATVAIAYRLLSGRAPLVAGDVRPPPIQSLPAAEWIPAPTAELVMAHLESGAPRAIASASGLAAALRGTLLRQTTVGAATSADHRDGTERLMREDAQFTVYRPARIAFDRWKTIAVFAHSAKREPDEPRDGPPERVRSEAKQLFGAAISEAIASTQDATRALPLEAVLRIVPHVQGVEFNPSERVLIWREDVQHETFRARVGPGTAPGTILRGSMRVRLGRLLIADVPLRFVASDENDAPEETTAATGAAYRKIFVSYSTKDSDVVEEVRSYVRVLGDTFLQDCFDLRAGEQWATRIEDLIRSADVFQLFWSKNAMDSTFVEAEWRYALALNRPSFVRPLYWERPMPRDEARQLPPPELGELHFQPLLRPVRATPPPFPPSSPTEKERKPKIELKARLGKKVDRTARETAMSPADDSRWADSSGALFSRRDLASLEEERVGEERAEQRHREAEERQRRDEERRAREEDEARRIAEEADRMRAEARTAREESVRAEAVRQGEIERARAQAEERAHIAAMEAQRAHERLLENLRTEEAHLMRRRRHLLVALAVAFVAAIFGLWKAFG